MREQEVNIKALQKEALKKLLVIEDILDETILEGIDEIIKKENVENSRFENPREDYARKNYFMYYETYIIGIPTIILEYMEYKVALPWQCNANMTIFKKVVDVLVKTLNVKAENSSVPKEDTTNEKEIFSDAEL
jgi:hypothetical protein